MGSANKPATTTTVQQTAPWSQTSGQLDSMVNNVGNLAQDTNLWAPSVSGYTQSGINQLGQLGQNGPTAGNQALSSAVGNSQLGMGTGLGTLSNIASGSYLNSNPYLQAALAPAIQQTENAVNSQFTGAGRYGSGDHASELARQVGNLTANADLSNYNTQMGNMQNAANTLYGSGLTGAGLATQLDQSSMTPALASLQAGTMADQLANQTKQAPINAVNWQNSVISPLSNQYGTNTSNSQTLQPVNPLTQALGLGQMGLGLLGNTGSTTTNPFTGSVTQNPGTGLLGLGASTSSMVPYLTF